MSYMNFRTVSLKLLTSADQSAKLSRLADAYALACNSIASVAQEHRCWNRVALHHLSYYTVREQVPKLGSQMVCQAIHRVSGAYKTLKAKRGIEKDKPVPLLTFSTASVDFDKRTYSIKSNTVSLFTLTGRTKIQFVCGAHQRRLLEGGASKEAKLVARKGVWYLNLVVELPDASPPADGEGGAFGVDVGESNLAATSTGKVWGGGRLRHERDAYLAHRRRLQANGSRAAKRKLRAISGREARHVKHVNHETSKAIVAEALRVGANEVRLEDLTHIRKNIKAGKRVRARLHRWAFRQLQTFVAYKAEAIGFEVTYINPAYTSSTCSVCGAKGKRERHSFSCLCGTRLHADVNASRNIAGFAEPIDLARAVVTQPIFAHKVHPVAAESSVL